MHKHLLYKQHMHVPEAFCIGSPWGLDAETADLPDLVHYYATTASFLQMNRGSAVLARNGDEAGDRNRRFGERPCQRWSGRFSVSIPQRSRSLPPPARTTRTTAPKSDGRWPRFAVGTASCQQGWTQRRVCNSGLTCAPPKQPFRASDLPLSETLVGAASCRRVPGSARRRSE